MERQERRFRLLTEEEIHEWTRIPIATLRTMRSRPSDDPIPYTKLGRHVRYREDLVLKWIERNTYNSDNVLFESA